MAAVSGEAPSDDDEPIQRGAILCGEENGSDVLPPRRTPFAPRTLERGILNEDSCFKLLQCRRRLKAERLHQGGAPDTERLECLSLSAGAVERDHQLAAQAVVQWMLGHKLLELCYELRAVAQLELGFDALL